MFILSILSYFSNSGVTNDVTDNFPSVRVPVLSVNKMFNEPDVSIPTNFLTKTFLFIILFILEESTSVIIIGSPSGTAITITATLNVTA